MQLQLNTSPRYRAPLTAADRALFGPEVIVEVRQIMSCLDYPVTALHPMSAFARQLEIGALLIKDESNRSPLGSFKALGGAYAVVRWVLAEAARRLGRAVAVNELKSDAVREVARSITVTCATDGNHGRSVAAGARLTGCRAVIYVHAGVSDARVQAIRDLGAAVVRIDGSYDDSVSEAARVGQIEGRVLISDTSWPGYEEIPATVMQGYLLMVDEVIDQSAACGARPTHVFLQAGVGGFAAATAAHLSLRWEEARPRFIVVEPERAACLFHSAVAHRRIRIEAAEPTVMSMLECYEPSLIAWRILERLADAFITIGETPALRVMQRLAEPAAPDPFVLSGESGGAGLAGLVECASNARSREALGIDNDSVILTFNTEGATDRALYDALLATAPK